jgi:ribonuclease Z
MKFEVTILGSSSATPIYQRNPTSQILNLNEKILMIDCGEGTQNQMLRYGIKFNKIDSIFISHLHGDHFFGLVGLISSMNLNGRIKSLNIFCPPALKDILDIQFFNSGSVLRFVINYYFTNDINSETIYDGSDYSVETIILNHRIPCTGFLFRQKKRMRKIIKQKVDELKISKEYIPLIKKGFDFTDQSGKVHSSKSLTTDADEPRSYAYCSDTLCSLDYLESIKNVNLLYHESTFLQEMVSRAHETFHTTALEAGQLAKTAQVEQLLIGHFSARYKDINPLLLEAQTIFANSHIAIEGKTFIV